MMTLDELLELKAQRPTPVIVCLCGSMQFAETFEHIRVTETLAGKIVLKPDVNTKQSGIVVTKEQKITLDLIHLAKIERADEVLILNVGGYLGASTLRELTYAQRLGKPIRWLESPTICDLVFIGLWQMREQVREPGKSGLVIHLDEFAKSIDMTAVALRRCLIKLDESKRIVSRKMSYPDYYPESWSVSFVEEASPCS
jgi:acetylglutamate synthase